MLRTRTAAALLFFALSAGGASGCKNSSSTSEDAGSTEVAAKEPVEVKLPGIDTSALTPRERREFSGYVTELLAPCPEVPVSVAQCVLEKRACGSCQLAAKWLAKQVQNGRPREMIEKGYKGRFDPTSVKKIPLDGSPSLGPESAPVTIVEFADFECPGCAAMVPNIDKLLEERKNDVRLVYKIVVLSLHQHAEAAARAALAAANQGKFWEMHHLLFQNQMHLEQVDLERYARMLNLDMAKFKADFNSDAVKDRIERDRKLGTELGIDHTPTLYMNGREVEPLDELGEWVAAELGEAGKAGKPDAGGPAGDAGIAGDAGKGGEHDGGPAGAHSAGTPGKK